MRNLEIIQLVILKLILRECLNDGVSNEGIFLENEKTDQRNTPEEPLMCVRVSPGSIC